MSIKHAWYVYARLRYRSKYITILYSVLVGAIVAYLGDYTKGLLIGSFTFILLKYYYLRALSKIGRMLFLGDDHDRNKNR